MIQIDLSDRRVVVTGSAGGIGSAIARRFCEAGATVVAQARDVSPALHELRGDHPNVTVAIGEIEDPEFSRSLFTGAHQKIILVNNAGIYPSGGIPDTPSSVFKHIMDNNIVLTYGVLHAAVEAMRSAGGGSIINIASLNASRPMPNQSAYNSAKAAIVSLTQTAAIELAPFGVRVNAVSPGLIERPTLRADWPDGVRRWEAACPSRRLGQGLDVANACVFLASDLADWITGQELLVDGGMSVVSPY